MTQPDFTARIEGRFVDDEDFRKSGKAWVEIDSGNGLMSIPLTREMHDLKTQVSNNATAARRDAETATSQAASAQTAASTATSKAAEAGRSATAAQSSATNAARSASQAAENARRVPRDGERGPAGPTGPAGPVGPAPTIRVGTVQKGDVPQAVLRGSNGTYTLDLTLPKGDAGPRGAQGPVGPAVNTSGLLPKSDVTPNIRNNGVVQRDGAGQILVPYPNGLSSATSKQYVDGVVAGKADKADPRFTDARAPKEHRHNVSSIDFTSNQLVLGYRASTSGDYAVVAGTGASVTSSFGTAVGQSASAGSSATALGYSATANSYLSVALGYNAEAKESYTVALGGASRALHSGSVAIGNQATTTANNQIMLGTSTKTVVVPGRIEIQTPTSSNHAATKAYVDSKLDGEPFSITPTNVRQSGKMVVTRSGRVVEVVIAGAAIGEIGTIGYPNYPNGSGTRYFAAVDEYNTTYPAHIKVSGNGVVTASGRSGANIYASFTYLADN